MGSLDKQLVWLVTGTSSGFGREFVVAALARGDKVIATARPKSVHKLKEIQEKGADVIELDVAWPFNQLVEVVKKAESIYGRVDALFNNAGYAEVMAIEETSSDETFELFNTHVFGGLNLVRAVLPGMRARKEGTIVWNGSLLGWQPGCGVGLYSAAKACVRGLSQVLHAEIAPLGLRSLVVEPGYFRTSIIDKFNPYETRIADYRYMMTATYESFKLSNASLPGDLKRGVQVILDLVRGEGIAQGRSIPTTLPLGTDCFEAVESVCQEELQILKEWKDVIVSTDLPK